MKTKPTVGTTYKITQDTTFHNFKHGTHVTVTSLAPNGVSAFVKSKTGNVAWAYFADLEPVETTKTPFIKKAEVLKVAKLLLKANNTVTTLEVKRKLITDVPNIRWTQDFVSTTMNEFASDRTLTFVVEPKGQYRVYSNPSTPVQQFKKNAKRGGIKYTTALKLIKENGSKFFTVKFVEQGSGKHRTMTCQYLAKQDPTQPLVVKVKEVSQLKTNPSKSIRGFRVDSLLELKVSGKIYVVNN